MPAIRRASHGAAEPRRPRPSCAWPRVFHRRRAAAPPGLALPSSAEEESQIFFCVVILAALLSMLQNQFFFFPFSCSITSNYSLSHVFREKPKQPD